MQFRLKNSFDNEFNFGKHLLGKAAAVIKGDKGGTTLAHCLIEFNPIQLAFISRFDKFK